MTKPQIAHQTEHVSVETPDVQESPLKTARPVSPIQLPPSPLKTQTPIVYGNAITTVSRKNRKRRSVAGGGINIISAEELGEATKIMLNAKRIATRHHK
jgi:hypothetical protein